MDEAPKRNRVVITGIGTVTSYGDGVESFWDNILAGKSGIDTVQSFDITDYPSKVGAEALHFNAGDYMDPKEARRNDRYTQFAVAASRLALKDADLDPTTLDADRFGVLIGSGIGGMITIQTQSRRLFEGGPRKVSPFMIPSLIANIASGVVAIEVGARGPNYGIVSACASGTHSIGEAFKMLRDSDADIMLAGGSEAAVTELGYAGFCSMKAMSTSYNDAPQTASRPFDKGRDGFIMGEGSGVLVMETLEHAQARGANIICEIAGYGATCDAYHITSPDPEGKALGAAITKVIQQAGLQPEDVSYINAHGTSTPYNDKFETGAIKKALGDHAYKIPVSSTKGMTGHLLGAAGGIESAVCALAIRDSKVPPTINYTDPDPDCDLDCVPNEARDAEVNVAICNNLGFGGHNATLLFKKFV
ncbi:MAG: beta-ketoacyl-ACP synthase II [Opitutales bacterium]|jgi:3-oxoacyl-[acyl-carrier-protein] synthase II|nr:beta-ketoacyl-ACP synthase II [Opitutales bacterium]MDP4643291.1 beta-ketoacyl-ACP synthase II [Opitutales bacterium]MDP4693847.1 beta-ketoacyl-ACP synthase II [Opitutales bacterium]MDP4777685.1 beta-ketoacyl-ACP synthase II [Opitutales bacterium]MDP4879208.1 beta-ketoacyl-ACP synthase II [Opitutales bacterium]